jgi:4-amino-4-deoxy-L-arabinose transferase-like glycosyltransferase
MRLSWPATLTGAHALALAGVIALALVFRVHDLTGLPTGLHGDEAATGLDARRILDEGWIGPYTIMAAGQPTGPLYLYAIPVGLFGSDVLSLRIVPAVLGSLTVGLLYVTTARSYGRVAGLFAAVLLAGMQWHIHYSRIAYPLIAWPLLAVGLVAALSAAVQSTRWSTWVLAGALCGGGIYLYNAHVGLIAICFLFLLGWLVAHRYQPLLPDLGRVGLFVLAMFIVAIPMIDYARDHQDFYFAHFERDALTNTPEWAAQENIADKAGLIRERYVDYWRKVVSRPAPDGLDGMGTSPVLSRGLFFVAFAGVPMALWRRPHLAVLALLVVLLMPFASVMTVDAFARRTLVMAPFVALFGGVALAELVRLGSGGARRWTLAWGGRRWQPRVSATVASAGAVLICASIIWAESTAYFSTFRAHSVNRWTYGHEFVEAIEFMRDEPSGTQFYFYSNRWPTNHETRRFLAPDISVVDRSSEHGEFTTDLSEEQPTTFVLLGTYRPLLADLQGRYPGGSTTIEGPLNDPWFIAYSPPPPAR